MATDDVKGGQATALKPVLGGQSVREAMRGHRESGTPLFALGTRDDLAALPHPANEPAVTAEPVAKAPVPEPIAAAGSGANRDEQVSALVHDVKTPLTIIQLEATLLEQRIGSRAAASVQNSLDRIKTNAAYVDRMVADLLDLVSAENSNLELVRARIDVARLLADAVRRGVASVDMGRLQLDVREPLYVIGDAGRLERVICNLIANALDHGPGASVTVRLDRREQDACISVIDSGPGLTEAQLAQMFEPRRRFSAKRDGHGLGLYISRRIVEAHDGRIAAASTPGRGTRVSVTLPVAQ